MKENLVVLYAEDEEDIRDITEFALEDEGFELIVCESGLEAVLKAPDVYPDLVLLDMMMPGMDGMTTAKKLKEFPHMENLPIIFMTAKVQSSDIDEYKKAGAAGVISKPFDAMELPQKLREILNDFSGDLV